MEAILEKLLVSDSKVVQEGTSQLRRAFADPSSITALCEVLVTSQRADVRHMTVVLLRRRFCKKRMWTKLPPDTRILIKKGMISALVNENDRNVKTGIAQMLGQLGKHELASESWPELLVFIFSLCSSTNILEKELGMYTLSITTEISHGSYIVHFEPLAELFTATLNSIDDFSSNLAYNTLKTMKNLVPAIAAHQQMINVYLKLLPRLLEIIKVLACTDEHRGVEALGILEELIDYAVVVIMPNVDNVVEMCLRIGCDNTVPTGTQVKAISIVGWLIKSKGKVIVKHQLIPPIIDVLMELMSREPETECDEEYFAGDSDQLTPVTVATQTLDLIALNVPADKVVDYILQKIEPYIKGSDVNRKKAAFLCLAILAEGCSECIRKKFLGAFIDCVYEAMKDNNNIVKNAAFFALGQFSEHLQPEVSQYSERLMPLLLGFLDHVYVEMQKEKKEPNCLDRLFYAIGTFCENLGEGLIPYLPLMMDKLFKGLHPEGWSMELKKACFSSLEAAIIAAKLGVLPYFSEIIHILHVYINGPEDSDNAELRSCALDCLAVLADGVGEENFKPLAKDSLQMALKLIDTPDPDIRRALFCLFGALTGIMKEEIVPSMPKIIQEMINTLQNSDGIVTYYNDEDEKNDLDVFRESESDSEEEDIGSTDSEELENCHYSVENPFTEEKEQACLTLKELCEKTNIAFLPYIEKCTEEVLKLMDYPRDQIRVAAIEAVLQFCVTLHYIGTIETRKAMFEILRLFIPKSSEIIRLDEEKGVVTAALDAFSSLLNEVKGDALVGEGHREAILNCVIDVLAHKTICQDNDLSVMNSYENFEESTDAEQDEILLESACDIIPKLGKSLPSDDFALCFQNILILLGQRTKKTHSTPQRSFSFGTLADCMACLGIYVETFVPPLMELWMAGIEDPSEEVRNNAIYGLGEMMLHGKDKIFKYYPDILRALSRCVNKEQNENALDNICGAIAKAIIVNQNGLPLDQVFPVLLDRLPLRVDFQENDAIIKCFFLLYQNGAEILKMNMVKVIRILIHILLKNETQGNEIKTELMKLITSINQTFNAEFADVVGELDRQSIDMLQQIFNLGNP